MKANIVFANKKPKGMDTKNNKGSKTEPLGLRDIDIEKLLCAQ